MIEMIIAIIAGVIWWFIGVYGTFQFCLETKQISVNDFNSGEQVVNITLLFCLLWIPILIVNTFIYLGQQHESQK